MAYPEIRHKIEQQLAQLPTDQLTLVSDFLDSLQSKLTAPVNAPIADSLQLNAGKKRVIY